MPDEAQIGDDPPDVGPPLKVRCPKCKELISDGAVICMVCKSDLLPKVPCPVCKAPINEGAKVCSTCKSDLSWKRHLSFSNTTLALLTALLAVAGTVGAQIKHFIWPPNSNVSVVWVNSTFGQIPKQIELTVMNTGELAGTIVEASMFMRVPAESPWLKKTLKGQTDNRGFEGWWGNDLMIWRDKEAAMFTVMRPLKFFSQQPPFTLEPGPAKRVSLAYPYPESEEKPLPTGPELPRSDFADCHVQLSVIDARGRLSGIRTLKTFCNLGSPWSVSASSSPR